MTSTSDPSTSDLEAVDLYRALDRQAAGLARRMLIVTGEHIEPELVRFMRDVDLPLLHRPLDRDLLDAALRRLSPQARSERG